MWSPIPLEHLAGLIAESVAKMDGVERIFWELIRIEPEKWILHPWGDRGGGFWVVALMGRDVVWFNDIEWGFNVSPFATYGVIAEYRCNQDELHHLTWSLRRRIEGDETRGMADPPSA